MFIEKFLTLPPVEKRYDLPLWAKKHFFSYFRKENDDSYIYYLFFLRSFILCMILAFLNLTSFLFDVHYDFFLFEINFPDAKSINEYLLWSFPFYSSTIILLIVLPLHIVMFRKYVDPKTFDTLWWNKKFWPEHKRRRGKILRLYIPGIFLLIATMYSSFAVPWYIMQGLELHESYIYFLFLLLFLSSFISWMGSFVLTSIAVLWRYIGRYEGY